MRKILPFVLLFALGAKSIFYDLSYINYVQEDRLYLTYLLSALLLVISVWGIVQKKEIFINRFTVFAGFCILYIVLTILFNGQLHSESQNVGLAIMLVLVLLTLNGQRSRYTDIHTICEVLVLTGFVLSLQGLFEYYNTHSASVISGRLRNGNLFSLVLVFSLPASVTCLTFPEPQSVRKKVFEKLALFNVLSTVYISIFNVSRTAILCIAVLLIYTLLFRNNNRSKLLHTKRRKFLLAFLVLSAICTLYFLKPQSADGRLLINKIAIPAAFNKPFLGHGYNSFKREYPYYQAAYFKSRPGSGLIYLADDVTNSFNEFTQIFFENGLVGLLFFILMLSALGLDALKTKEKDHRLFKTLFLLLFLLTSLFYAPLRDFDVLSILFINLLAFTTNPSGSSIFRLRKRQSILLFSASSIIALFIFTQTIPVHKGQLKWYSLSKQNPSPEEILVLSRQNNRSLQDNGEFCYYAGAMLYKNEDIPQAMHYLKKALSLYTSTEVLTYMGNVYTKKRQFDSAIYYYTEAKNMVPSRFIPRHKLMKIYAFVKDTTAEKNEAAGIEALKVKIHSPIVDSIKKDAKMALSY